MKTTLVALLIVTGGQAQVATGVAVAQSEMEDMQFIEGGTFQIGDVFDEGVRFATPVHEVTVASFYLNKYEVTVEAFSAFVKDAGYITSNRTEPLSAVHTSLLLSKLLSSEVQ